MDIISRMNWVDVISVTIMIRISYVAFKDGLSHEIFPLVGSVGTVLITLYYYEDLAALLSQNLVGVSAAILEFLSFIMLIIIVGFIFKFLRVILNKVINVTWHPFIERFGGLIAGIVRGAVVVSTILIMLALMPLSYFQYSIRDRSLTGMYFLKVVPVIYGRTCEFLPRPELGKPPLDGEKLTAKIIGDKKIKLPDKKMKQYPDWEESERKVSN